MSNTHVRACYVGPYTWGEDYPQCAGKSQSPINIVPQEAEDDKALPIINRRIFDSPPTKMKLQNNGHSRKLAGQNLIRFRGFVYRHYEDKHRKDHMLSYSE